MMEKIKKSDLLEKIEGVNKSVEALKYMLLRKGVLTEDDFTSYIIEKHDIKEAVISDCKPAEQPQFEVGKVYKSTKRLTMFYCIKGGDFDSVDGFGFDYLGNWIESIELYNENSHHYSFTEATHEEWFKRLEEEAKKRGFREGVIVDGKEIKGTFFKNALYHLCSHRVGYNGSGVEIMSNGKWTEIIKEPQRMTVEQRDELAKPFIPDEYQVGTLGAFWDGDYEDALNNLNIYVGYFGGKTDNERFHPINLTCSWENFKPLKFD